MHGSAVTAVTASGTGAAVRVVLPGSATASASNWRTDASISATVSRVNRSVLYFARISISRAGSGARVSTSIVAAPGATGTGVTDSPGRPAPAVHGRGS